jgi:hypothetical protein
MNPPLCSSGSDTGGRNTVEERRFSAAKKPKPNRALPGGRHFRRAAEFKEDSNSPAVALKFS